MTQHKHLSQGEWYLESEQTHRYDRKPRTKENLSRTADSKCSSLLQWWTYLLGEGLLKGGQGSVCVTGVGLQRFDPVLQVSQLLVFVSQLLLQVLNLASQDGNQMSWKGNGAETQSSGSSLEVCFSFWVWSSYSASAAALKLFGHIWSRD